MKTKLFYLFFAIFLFSVSGKSQTCPPNWPYAHCISLIGPGISDWSTDVYLTSADGNVFTLVDVLIKETAPGSGIGGEIKFRRDGAWDSLPGNPPGYGPATGSGFPAGSGESVPFGPNIKPNPGVWNVTFTLSTKSWAFTPGTPVPTVKIFGTATTPSTGVSMSATSKTTFEIKKLALKAGNAQFEVNTTPGGAPTLAILGGLTFPNGVAEDETKFIPVGATNDYDVTLDLTSGAYTFKIATFPIIDIIGNGTTGNQAGWSTGIDLSTTDGITYTIKNLKLYATSSDSTPTPNEAAGVKFRLNNDWGTNWGGTSFPTGPSGNNENIMVNTGTYNVTFNRTTGAYAFSFPVVDIIGNGITGNESGWASGIDMATTDGVNYTITRTLFATSSDSTPTPGSAAGVKFRLDNSWNTNWGGTSFPTGPTGNNENIMVAAGTYAIKFNRETGAYDFGTNLSVTKFDAKSFRAYPNPTRGSWNITSNDDITSIQVYDVLGKTVYTKFSASKEVSVDATELSKGVYFAKVSSANGTSTLKLVKE